MMSHTILHDQLNYDAEFSKKGILATSMVSVHWSPWLNSAKVAEFSKPTIVLFANITAADFKKGNIIMFAMVSSCPERVDPRADQSLGGQFACAPMYYGVFSTIIDVTYGSWGVFVWCALATRKGFT